MTEDVVLIPTYDRPEYLAMCFEKLAQARGIEDKLIMVCQDQHIGASVDFTGQWDMLAALKEGEKLLGVGRIKFSVREPHDYYGNSYNVLEGLKEASKIANRRVYLVEDDVMVMPDFFEWHEAVRAMEYMSPFVTCAGRINRSLNFQMNGPEAIDESVEDPLALVASCKAYMSWATCFDSDWIGCVNKDVDYKIFKPGFEQDMMIQDFIVKTSLDSIWPYVPRAYHMGWYSYHRTAGMKFEGTLKEKVDALRRAITNRSTIRAMACLQEIDPFPNQPIPEYDPKQLYLLKDYR